MKIVKIFYDLETTGVDHRKHSLHQLSGMVEIDGEIVESFNIRVAPHPKCKVEAKAMEICNTSEEVIRGYTPMGQGYELFTNIVKRYINPYDKTEKAYLVGFNNRYFDDTFLRAWFEHNKDMYFGSLFWVNSLDVFVLAAEYLISRRSGMPNFRLKTVALELGLFVDEERLHDASYDVELTREIYRIVTGLVEEL